LWNSTRHRPTFWLPAFERGILAFVQRFSFSHRFTAWMALVGYAIVASGLPLPMGASSSAASNSPAAKRLAGKDRSRPFPCMDKPCGCATAEQCFSNCCCNSPAELLAWAKANRIDPAVIVALKRRAAAPAVSVKRSCCSPKAETSCCESPSSAPTAIDEADVCSDYRSLAANPEWPDDDEDHREESWPVSEKVVVLRAMLACGGIVAQWSAIGISLPPPPVVSCEKSAEPAGEVACHDESFLSERAAPDAPPPRV
jgi:hypothetical protein